MKPPVDLQLSTNQLGGTQVVALGGVADLSTAPSLRDYLVRATSQHAGKPLVVDIDGVTLLDDVAIGLIIGAGTRCREAGTELTIVCSPGRIRDRLTATKLDQIVTVHDSIS